MGCSNSQIEDSPKQFQNPQKHIQTPQIFITDQIHSQNLINYVDEIEPSDKDIYGDYQKQKIEKLRKQEQKLKYLKENQNFIELSIQTSLCVNQALTALSYNPLLFDESYKKLININKKSLEKKQNRIKNLKRRSQRAEFDIQKMNPKKSHQKYNRSVFNDISNGLEIRYHSIHACDKNKIQKQNLEKEFRLYSKITDSIDHFNHCA